MASSVQQQHENLQRLTAHIGNPAPCCPVDADRAASCQHDAWRMPLSHSTSQALFEAIVAGGQLSSNDARGEPSREVDTELGTTNDVFVYLGTPAFPKREFAFVFKCSLTESANSKAVATPFDSGGCARHFGLPVGTHVEFVRNHELPVPECRDYLGVMLGHCFASVESYLLGNPYFECPGCGASLADPHGLIRSSPSQDYGLDRMHEVRIEGKISSTLTSPRLLSPRGLSRPRWPDFSPSGFKSSPTTEVTTTRIRSAPKPLPRFCLSSSPHDHALHQWPSSHRVHGGALDGGTIAADPFGDLL